MRKFMSRWIHNAPIVMRIMSHPGLLLIGFLLGTTVATWNSIPESDQVPACFALALMVGLSYVVTVTLVTIVDRFTQLLRVTPRSAPIKTAARPNPQPSDPELEAEMERIKARMRESWALLNDPEYEEMTVRAPVDPTPNAPGGDC